MADAIRVSSLQRANVCMRKESALSTFMSFSFSCMDGLAGIMNCLGHEGSANIGILFPANNTSVRCPKAKHLYTIALLLQPGSVFSAEFGIYTYRNGDDRVRFQHLWWQCNGTSSILQAALSKNLITFADDDVILTLPDDRHTFTTGWMLYYRE